MTRNGLEDYLDYLNEDVSEEECGKESDKQRDHKGDFWGDPDFFEFFFCVFVFVLIWMERIPQVLRPHRNSLACT